MDKSSLDSLTLIIKNLIILQWNKFHWVWVVGYWYSNVKYTSPFFLNIPFGIVMFFVVVRTITFGQHSWFIAVINWEGILIFFTVVGPGLNLYHPRAIKETWEMNHTCVTKHLLEESKNRKIGILKNYFVLFRVSPRDLFIYLFKKRLS